MSKKWVEICKILQKRCTEAQFKVWIEPLFFRFSESEQKVTLLAPSQYVADFLNSRFYTIIYDTLCDIYGKKCSLVIISSEKEGALNIRKTNAISFSNDKAACEHQEKTDLKNLKEKQSIENEPLPPTEKQSIINPHRVACEPRPLIRVQKNDSVDARPLPRPLPAAQMMLPVTAPVKAKFFWKHSFNDFIVGSSNELAYVASKSMCNNAISSDVLFLNSPAGLGKTHLLQSVGKTLCEQSNLSSPKVEYLTAEEFASQFYFSLKSQSTDRFKERYRGLDLLLLEDVHFLQGKEKLQAELLATIKALSHRRGKVIFTSSFSARDLTQMDEQLQSRICSGFMSSIDRPDENTRREIFRKKASLYQVKLPEEVEEMLAHYIKKDVRQIESCLHNLVLKARLFKCGITMQMAWEVICNFAAESPILDMSGIISFVCRGFGVSREQLSSLSRKKEYVVARNTIFFLARKHTDLSLDAIGKNFNRRHSTVLKGITNIEREMSRETPLGKQVTNTVNMIERNGNLVNADFPI